MTDENQNIQSNTQAGQLQIQLPPEIAHGSYINLSLVNHTENEFIFDFIFVQPQQPRATVRSRVITSPRHAKQILMALHDNVQRYESQYGAIQSAPAAAAVPTPSKSLH